MLKVPSKRARTSSGPFCCQHATKWRLDGEEVPDDQVLILEDPDAEDVLVHPTKGEELDETESWRHVEGVEGPSGGKTRAEQSAASAAAASEAVFIMGIAAAMARTATGASTAEVLAAQTAIRVAVTEHVAAIYGSAAAANEAAYGGYLARTLNALKSNPAVYGRMVFATAVLIAGMLGGALLLNRNGEWEFVLGDLPDYVMEVPSLGAEIEVAPYLSSQSMGIDLTYHPIHDIIPDIALNPLRLFSPVTQFIHDLVAAAVPEASRLIHEGVVDVSPLPELRVVLSRVPAGRLQIGLRVGVSPTHGLRPELLPYIRPTPRTPTQANPRPRPGRMPNRQPVLRPQANPRALPAVRHARAESTFRKDQKWKSTQRYLAVLNIVNKTWGRISEVMDVGKALIDNLYDETGEVRKIRRWDQAYELMRAGRLELDVEGFLMQVMYQELMDRGIAMLGRAEDKWMKDHFPLDHPLNNMFGRPSTWVSRAMKLREGLTEGG